jgi:hypothetical protein
MSDAIRLCAALERLVIDRLFAVLGDLSEDTRRDMYVLALMLVPQYVDRQEDFRVLSVHAHWNTNARAHAASTTYGRPLDARWLHSRWVERDGVELIGTEDDDLRLGWVKALGHWYEPEDRVTSPDDTYDHDVEIWGLACRGLVAIARAITQDDRVVALLGSCPPIQVLTSDGNDPHMRMTIDANPQGLPEDLYDWFEGVDAVGPDGTY